MSEETNWFDIELNKSEEILMIRESESSDNESLSIDKSFLINQLQEKIKELEIQNKKLLKENKILYQQFVNKKPEKKVMEKDIQMELDSICKTLFSC